MKTLVIVISGDNPRLAEEALAVAVEAVEKANPTNSVYRAYVKAHS